MSSKINKMNNVDKIISKSIAINESVNANVVISLNYKDITKIKNKISSVHEKQKDGYAIFSKNNINKVWHLNRKQVCKIVSIQLLVCYQNETFVPRKQLQNSLFFYHHSLSEQFLASKIVVYYKENNSINSKIELKSFFFKDFCKYLKSIHFDPICVLEIETLGRNLNEDITNYMTSSLLTLPLSNNNKDGQSSAKSIIMDVSKNFAEAFAKISDTIVEVKN